MVPCKVVSGFWRCWKEVVACVWCACSCAHMHACLNWRINIHGFLVSDRVLIVDIYSIHFHFHTSKIREKRILAPLMIKKLTNKKIEGKIKDLWPFPHSTDYQYFVSTSGNFYLYKEKYVYTLSTNQNHNVQIGIILWILLSKMLFLTLQYNWDIFHTSVYRFTQFFL